MKPGRMSFSGFSTVLIVWLVISFGIPATVFGKDNAAGKEKPDRLVTMAVEYPGIKIPIDQETVTMDVTFYNKGRSEENMRVWLSEKPTGWKAKLKNYRFRITELNVPSDDDKSVTFEASPDKGIKPGTYQFTVQAESADRKFKLSQPISIEVMAEEAGVEKSGDLKLTTSYPVIRGPSDASFKFSVDVKSNLPKEAVCNLSAKGPDGWEVNFKPGYEDKYISSLRLKENGSKSIDVEVKPGLKAQAGEYPIHIRVNSGKSQAEATLKIILTGTYGLEVGTPNGLLSLDAGQGKPSNISFYIKNTGSAKNNGIHFTSFKPENWKVEFSPEKIDSIDSGDLKQVEMTITPNEDALVGDYSISVSVEGEKVSKDLEFRTTVKASAAWGWIGIGIIVLVICGLFGLFRWLGRR